MRKSSAKRHFNKAYAALQKGDHHTAAREFTELIRLAPKSRLFHLYKGICLIKMNKLKRARRSLLRAISLEATPQGYIFLAVVEEDLGGRMRAIRAFKQALAIDDKCEEAHYNLGRLLRKANPTAALSHLRRAVRLDPKYAAAYRELGELLLQLNRVAAARNALEKAKRYDAKSIWTRLFLGNALWRLNRVKLAEQEFRAADRIDRTPFTRRILDKFLREKRERRELTA